MGLIGFVPIQQRTISAPFGCGAKSTFRQIPDANQMNYMLFSSIISPSIH